VCAIVRASALLWHIRNCLGIISVPLSISLVSVSTNDVDLSPSPSVGLCVCRSVCLSGCKVYCGKTTDWIQMPFGMVSGVSQGMGVLDGGGDR